MLNRRSVLKSGTAAAVTLALAPAARAATAQSGGAALNALFDTFVQENLDASPLFATALAYAQTLTPEDWAQRS